VGQGVPRADGVPEVELAEWKLRDTRYVLVYSQDPTVWNYTGDPEKLTLLIVAGEYLDIIGVPSEKVIHVPRSECTTFNMREQKSAMYYLFEAQVHHASGQVDSRFRVVETAARLPPLR
jgi:hypothetical protein